MKPERHLSPSDAVELAPSFHFRWEEPQKAHVLLYPEGIVKLSETAAAILETCTGNPSIAQGTCELQDRYGRSDLGASVLEFLELAHAKGWIRVKS
ncbi:MAG: pyrroloquinoline quinone biosynthesis peptide chaperone PqqD [Hyphomicrobium sp.]|jgi:pyrroloquinoline quinone biosynthesis protein D|nr:pyrroloquinoline quinone biosynthesis peptide chaperone PqqD [Hyphomicrobium sp.]